MTFRLAHLADAHLGLYQYTRTRDGRNAREQDIADAFQRAVTDIIAWKPDVMLVAGDLFHYARPRNTAIREAFAGFTRLRRELPYAPIVLIAGNHDHPRTTETGHLLPLFEAIPNLLVVTTEPHELRMGSLSVCAVPHVADPVGVVPNPDARWNVLLMHGDVPAVAHIPDREPGGRLLPTDETGWDYVALGHWHVPCQVGERTWYAGSLEYVSSNPWRESQERGCAPTPGGKGWLGVTLDETGTHVTFHPGSTRRVVDLPVINGAGLTPGELDAALARNVAAGTFEVARQVVTDVDPLVARQIDHGQVRAWKADALHYQLDLRRPVKAVSAAMMFAGRGRPLPVVLQEYLRERTISPAVDRAALLALAATLLPVAEASGREGGEKKAAK